MKTVSKNKKAFIKTLVVAIALLTSSVTYASSAALTAVGKKAKQERMMSPGYLQNGRLQKLLLQTKTGECMKQIPWIKKALGLLKKYDFKLNFLLKSNIFWF